MFEPLEGPSRSTRKPAWLTFNLVLSCLIAVLSIVAAYASYQGTVVGAASTDNFFAAQLKLSESNATYVEQGQNIIYDFSTYDSYVVSDLDNNEALSDYYFDQLSDELIESMDRADGPFDPAYYDAIYVDAEALLKESDGLFSKAERDNERALAYQLTVLIMAVGLSFAAWASLAEDHGNIRLVFTVLAVTSAVIGLGQMLTIPGPLP